LCRDHAPEADAPEDAQGAFTKKQLREMKKNPFIKENDVKGKFSWLRREIICMPGGNIIYNPDIILEVGNEKILWMEKDDEGFHRLNLIVKDTRGNTVLEIRNNDWIAETKGALEIVCPPSGKILRIKSKDEETEINIAFDDIAIDDFKKRLSMISRTWVFDIKRHNREELKHLREKWKKESLTKFGRQGRLLEFQEEKWDKSLDYVKRLSQEWPDKVVSRIGNPERVTTCTLRGRLFYEGEQIEMSTERFTGGGFAVSGLLTRGGTVFSFRQQDEKRGAIFGSG